MKRSIKMYLANEIANLESKYESIDRNSPLWVLLAHARAEWNKENFYQCNKDLLELKVLIKEVEDNLSTFHFVAVKEIT